MTTKDALRCESLRWQRPRGHKMGAAVKLLQARRDTFHARLYTILLWLACVTYGLALVAVLWMLAQAAGWGR